MGKTAARFKALWLAAVCLPISATASATPDGGAAPVPAGGPIGGGEIANLGVSMLVVVIAIVGLGWLYSRTRLAGGQGASDVISVVATRPLGPKERLLLIEIADQQLLVGMTASQVQTLHVFDEPVTTKTAEAATGGFARRLRSALLENKR